MLLVETAAPEPAIQSRPDRVLAPADLRRLRVEHRGDRALVECWLFSSTVEKGVLLRSRVLAAVGPSVGDTDWATPLADRFAASAPILSA